MTSLHRSAEPPGSTASPHILPITGLCNNDCSRPPLCLWRPWGRRPLLCLWNKLFCDYLPMENWRLCAAFYLVADVGWTRVESLRNNSSPRIPAILLPTETSNHQVNTQTPERTAPVTHPWQINIRWQQEIFITRPTSGNVQTVQWHNLCIMRAEKIWKWI